MIKEYNVSRNYQCEDQKDNEITPIVACGPTNMIQALKYSGWEWDRNIAPQFKDPADKLTWFSRTNSSVLEYYKTHYGNMYKNWINEAVEIAKKTGKEFWESECVSTNPPNEIHDVMSVATNIFMGYTANNRRVTTFKENGTEEEIIENIRNGLPVVSSVAFNGNGHYVTIVGFTYNKKIFENKEDVIDYIIDNTYGTFNFKTNKYNMVSGDDEHIERKKFLSMLKPLGTDKILLHTFTKGASTI